MRSTAELDALRQEAIFSSLAGFPFLLMFGCAWLGGGVLTYLLPDPLAPWSHLALGLPAAFLAIALERRIGLVPVPDSDPLLPLTLQLLFVQILAFPAVLLVWNFEPSYLPVALAAVVGAHFLPFQWVYRTRIYLFLALAVAVGPYGLAVVLGLDALHYTGFYVGALLLLGAFAVRAHALAQWRARGELDPGR